MIMNHEYFWYSQNFSAGLVVLVFIGRIKIYSLLCRIVGEEFSSLVTANQS